MTQLSAGTGIVATGLSFLLAVVAANANHLGWSISNSNFLPLHVPSESCNNEAGLKRFARRHRLLVVLSESGVAFFFSVSKKTKTKNRLLAIASSRRLETAGDEREKKEDAK